MYDFKDSIIKKVIQTYLILFSLMVVSPNSSFMLVLLRNTVTVTIAPAVTTVEFSSSITTIKTIILTINNLPNKYHSQILAIKKFKSNKIQILFSQKIISFFFKTTPKIKTTCLNSPIEIWHK